VRLLSVIALATLLGACSDETSATDGATGDLPGPAAKPPAAAPEPRLRFVDGTESAGLDAVTWCGREEKPHLLESAGNGLALVDYDGDGDLDVYLVSGWHLRGSEIVERTPNRLYRNRGDGTFEDVTAESGTGDTGWGCGVAVGDVDGDGWPDLHVTNFGPDVLFRNAGDGTFERVEASPGIDGWSAQSVFFDADGDGDEDLFVCGYIEATLEEVLEARPTLRWKGADVMMGPFGLEGLRNVFFRNDGGRFVDATGDAGLADAGSYFSFAAAAFDLEGDGDMDLYVANDSNPNYVYVNDGEGTFTETGLWSGASLSRTGAAQAGMGVAAGDITGDTLPEILVTHFAEDSSTLYRNLGRAVFTDATRESGLAVATYGPLSWGTVFADFDLDGDLDLFIANGHIYPQADEAPESASTWAQRNQLFENRGGVFHDPANGGGPGLDILRSSRGVAAGDLDGDGDLDLVVSNLDAKPTVLRNESVRGGEFLLIDAPGASAVEVEEQGRSFSRRRVRGGSFQSESAPRFHFGLGPVKGPIRVRVRWPDGETTVRTDVPANRVLRVK
jgi:hypothetical protein